MNRLQILLLEIKEIRIHCEQINGQQATALYITTALLPQWSKLNCFSEFPFGRLPSIKIDHQHQDT